MPHLRSREANLRGQIDALDAQTADRDAYLTLADDLEGFLAQLRGNAATATVEERQHVLRLLVKDILIGPEKITIRHRIPARPGGSGARQRHPQPDTEGDYRAGYPLRWGRARRPLRGPAVPLLQGPVGQLQRGGQPPPHVQHHPAGFVAGVMFHRLEDQVPPHAVEELPDVQINHPVVLPAALPACRHRVQRAPRRPVPVGVRVEHRFHRALQPGCRHGLRDPVRDSRDVRFILLSFPGVVRLGF